MTPRQILQLTDLEPPREAPRVPSTVALTDGRENCTAWLSAFTGYLRARSLGEKTISNYVQDMRKFQKKVAKDLATVTREDLRRVLKEWKESGASDATIRRCRASLRSFYDFLSVGGYIENRPTANLQVPKGWEKVPQAPAAADLERVIAAIGHDGPFHLRDRAILLLLRDSGPRATAAAHILLSDVDWQNQRLTIRHDKFGKQHVLPLSRRTLEVIREYVDQGRPYFLRGRDLPYLFLGYSRRNAADPTGPMTRQQFWYITKRWTKQVLGVAISPHKWRAACLTEGAEKGMDDFDLMNLAGHSSPEVTQRYIRHQIGHLKDRYYSTHPRAGKRPTRDVK
ncbi:MAG: tyrosine-type recombinase/integrase [Terriglobales bacterium]